MSDDFGMSGDDLEQMYQEVILEAARDPHGKAHFAPDLTQENDTATGQSSLDQGEASVRQNHEYCETGQSHQFNPTCGDEATIRVEVSQDEPHRIEQLEWDGHGCSISQASLSVMTDLVEGKTVDEAMNLGATRLESIMYITIPFLRPAIITSCAVAFLMSFENFNTTLFLVGSDPTLPINLYLQVRDGSTPVINAVSFLLIVGTSIIAMANLYFSRKAQ